MDCFGGDGTGNKGAADADGRGNDGRPAAKSALYMYVPSPVAALVPSRA